MKLVVITGCYGFIGSHVTAACLKKGWKVYGIDKETYAANRNSKVLSTVERVYWENFTYLKEDICNLKDLPDCDYIINTAAETHVGNSIIDSSDFIKSNFSTDEVYGDIVEGAHTEESPLSPSNPYSASKAAADMLIKAWARTYGIDYLILRPTNNYGPDQYPEKLIPLAVKLLSRGRKIRLHNKGEPYRNWLHAEDTAAAVIKIIESGAINQIFNVSGGFEQKNKETVSKIINSYFNGSYDSEYDKASDLLDLEYAREGQDVRYSVNDAKLRSLGWEPKKVFDQEIDRIVRHCKTNFKW